MPPPLGFILLTHNKPQQTLRLIATLNRHFHNPPIACHHDFSQSDLPTAGLPPNIRLVRPHLRTRWGHWNLVAATLAALRLLYPSETPANSPAPAPTPATSPPDPLTSPDWCTILSGSDYPIAPAERVYKDLATASADAFIQHSLISHDTARDPWRRICLRRYLCRNIRFHYINRHLRPSTRAVPLPYILTHRFTPFANPDFRCYAGSQWFTANRRCAQRILTFHAQSPALANLYRHTHVPDESYFHTILANDPTLKLLNDNKRFILWSTADSHPLTLTVRELGKAFASNAHFARKFDPDLDPTALDTLDRSLT